MIYIGIFITTLITSIFLSDRENLEWVTPWISGVMCSFFIFMLSLGGNMDSVKEINIRKEVVFEYQVDNIDTIYVHLHRLDTIVNFDQIEYRK